MAKRKRLGPATLIPPAPAPETKSAIPPIAGVAGDAALSGAFMELGERITAARREGRWIEPLPLASIVEDHLIRDRIATDADEMEALKASLRASGQQTAIEVEPLGEDSYGLISGWRRLRALRDLALEGGTDTVLAIIRQRGDAAEAYRAMVEENEIRADLSFYERGRIVARAADAGAYADDGAALSALFAAIPRARRSKIGSFLRIVRALDDHLRFPTALSERAGLALAGALKADPDLGARLAAALDKAAPRDAEAEAALIARMLARRTDAPVKPKPPAPEALPNGLTFQRRADGKVLLGGAALSDADFAERLKQTLSSLK